MAMLHQNSSTTSNNDRTFISSYYLFRFYSILVMPQGNMQNQRPFCTIKLRMFSVKLLSAIKFSIFICMR